MDKQRRDAPRFYLKGKKRGVPEGATAAGTRPPPSPARGCERSPFPTRGPGRRPRRGALAHGAGGGGQAPIMPAPPGRSRRGRGTQGPAPGGQWKMTGQSAQAHCSTYLITLPLRYFCLKATEIRGALPWQPAAGMLFGVSGLVKSPTVPISCSSGIIPTSRVLPPPARFRCGERGPTAVATRSLASRTRQLAWWRAPETRPPAPQ